MERVKAVDKHGILDEFRHVFACLPIEECTIESSNHHYLERQFFNHVTDFLQFVAPEGKIFKLSGDFRVRCESNDEAFHFDVPAESESLWDKNYQDTYEDDEDFVVPKYSPFFYGKRLGVAIGAHYFGQTSLPKVSHGNSIVNVMIEGPIDGYMMDGTRVIYLEERSGSDIFVPYYHNDPLAFMSWRYEIASGDMHDIKVELVEDDSQKPEFEPVYCRDDRDDIWIPNRISSYKMAEYYSRYGAVLTEEDRTNLMRQAREIGMPYNDDPLRDFKVIKQQGCSASIGKIATTVEEMRGQPILDLSEQSISPFKKRSYLRQVGRLVIATESVSLGELITDENYRQKTKLLGPQYQDDIEF